MYKTPLQPGLSSLMFLLMFTILSCYGSVSYERVVTRHALSGVNFVGDMDREGASTGNVVWDLNGFPEDGTYPCRVRRLSDSVFDVTARGMRVDWRVDSGALHITGIENGMMRLGGDSSRMAVAPVPMLPGAERVDTMQCLVSVGNAYEGFIFKTSVRSSVGAAGMMLFPDGDSLRVRRMDAEILWESEKWRLTYWYAEDDILPVARELAISLKTERGSFVETAHEFSYTYPTERGGDGVPLDSDLVCSVLGIDLSEGGSEDGNTPPRTAKGKGRGGTGEDGSDVIISSGDMVGLPLGDETLSGEAFIAIVADSSGIVWLTGEGTAAFGRCDLSVAGLPDGYYLVSVETASGRRSTYKIYHCHE